MLIPNPQGKAQRRVNDAGKSVRSLAKSCAQVLAAALENSTDSRHRSLIDDDFDPDPDFDFDLDDVEVEVEGKDDSDGEDDNL